MSNNNDNDKAENTQGDVALVEMTRGRPTTSSHGSTNSSGSSASELNDTTDDITNPPVVYNDWRQVESSDLAHLPHVETSAHLRASSSQNQLRSTSGVDQNERFRTTSTSSLPFLESSSNFHSSIVGNNTTAQNSHALNGTHAFSTAVATSMSNVAGSRCTAGLRSANQHHSNHQSINSIDTSRLSFLSGLLPVALRRDAAMSSHNNDNNDSTNAPGHDAGNGEGFHHQRPHSFHRLSNLSANSTKKRSSTPQARYPSDAGQDIETLLAPQASSASAKSQGSLGSAGVSSAASTSTHYDLTSNSLNNTSTGSNGFIGNGTFLVNNDAPLASPSSDDINIDIIDIDGSSHRGGLTNRALKDGASCTCNNNNNNGIDGSTLAEYGHTSVCPLGASSRRSLESLPTNTIDTTSEQDGDSLLHKSKMNYWKSKLEKVERYLKLRPEVIREHTSIKTPLFGKVLDAINNFLHPVVKPGITRLITQFIYCFIWVLIFAICVKVNNYDASTELGPPTYLTCTDTFWTVVPEDCGVDGVYCRPFSGINFVYRCPTDCASVYNVNQRWVGDKQDGYKMAWVVGSNGTTPDANGLTTGGYRGDSWICAASINAGVTSSAYGGCGVARVFGSSYFFNSDKRNGVTTMSFDSWFPKSYSIDSVESQHCKDNSYPLVPLFMAFIFFFPFTRPSLPLYIFCVVSAGAWQINFFGIPYHSDSWLSQAWGRYLITLMFTFTLYQLIFKFNLPKRVHKFAFDYFLLYIIPYMVGIFFEQITAPLSDFEFTSRAFKQTSTIIVFVILVPIIVIVVGFQLLYLRKFGKLGKYIYGYILFTIAITVIPKIIHLYLHLHHYIVGLILMPLTSIQTRSSLVGQGFLFGMTVQGLTRWGAATPFDTRFENLNGDPAGTELARFNINSTIFTTAGTISWTVDSLAPQNQTLDHLTTDSGYDSFSLAVNDVEVYRGVNTNFTLTQVHDDPNPNRPYYIRVALSQGGNVLDYNYPAVVFGNGTFYYPNN